MSDTWDNCPHEWAVKIDSQFHSENFTEVYCKLCDCSGEKNEKTGDVYWPAT